MTNEETQEEKTYKCAACGSESKVEPGECCDTPRKEKCEKCDNVKEGEQGCVC